jgi:hypothetical protein
LARSVLCAGAVASPLACSITATPIPITFDGGSGDEGGVLLAPDASSTGTTLADGGVPHADSGPPTCTPTACGIELCVCDNGTEQASGGVCGSAGNCAFTTACTQACAGPSSGALIFPGCSSAADCQVDPPDVNCVCTGGIGTGGMAEPICTSAGVCSDFPEDVCPSICAQQSAGAWAGCAQDSDCAPVVCDCHDGTRPIDATGPMVATGHCQSDGTCLGGTSYCPTACASHGGWTPPTMTMPDAGPMMGNGQPGSPCTDGSQCIALSCACQSMLISGIMACDTSSDTCESQADACPLLCSNYGGWSGM